MENQELSSAMQQIASSGSLTASFTAGVLAAATALEIRANEIRCKYEAQDSSSPDYDREASQELWLHAEHLEAAAKELRDSMK